ADDDDLRHLRRPRGLGSALQEVAALREGPGHPHERGEAGQAGQGSALDLHRSQGLREDEGNDDAWRGSEGRSHEVTAPLVIAHRGDSAHRPENTLAAFASALEVGAELVELDVQLTADGHVVVIHDATLDRTTSGRGPVVERTLAEVRALSA